MSTRILAAAFFASTLFSSAAMADWQGNVAEGNYGWTESIQHPALTIRENGSRYALQLKWMESDDNHLLYGYSAKLYTGHVQYDTYTQSTYPAVSTQTDYNGITHEGLLISRRNTGNYQLDYVGALGRDSWRHMTDTNQIEDYSIWFVRTGINLDQPMHRDGFHGGGGLKLPFRTSEDAHLDSAGFDSNPQLTPGKSVSLYAELAYRTKKDWDIVGYYDSWRFKESEPVTATSGGNIYSIVQPQSSIKTFGLKAMYAF